MVVIISNQTNTTNNSAQTANANINKKRQVQTNHLSLI